MRVALIHYWLVNWRGGERVLEAIAALFPEADIYTHVLRPDALPPGLRERRIVETAIARLPFARRLYPLYLPLMPHALERLDLRGYDLVISSEAGPAKGVITAPGTQHVCYVHAPLRYVWHLYPEYRATLPGPLRPLADGVARRLRRWDQLSAARPDHIIANSSAVARRIAQAWRREARVIHPPVDTALFAGAAGAAAPEDYYLCAGQLVPYKRVDLAVAACAALGRRLVVIGEGPMRRRLERMAGPGVTFLGHQPLAELRRHYARCRALLFPGEEDFGIVPVEAMASGRPVIAYGRGGALDTVVPGLSGRLFTEQSVAGLSDAIRAFEAEEGGYAPARIRAHAARFDRALFLQRFRDYLSERGISPPIAAAPAALAPPPATPPAGHAPPRVLVPTAQPV